MQGINRVCVLGNVGVDPELRRTQSGDSVLPLRIATEESYKDKQGSWQKRTEWHSAALWGKRAESLSQYLHKGTQVYIEGSLRTSSYETKEGLKQHKTEIVVRDLVLCGGRSQGYQSTPPPARVSAPAARRTPSQAPLAMPPMPPMPNFDEDDLPF